MLVQEQIGASRLQLAQKSDGLLQRPAEGSTDQAAIMSNLRYRIDPDRMIRRRTADAGFKVKLGCHVFRATGITPYLEAGGNTRRMRKPWLRMKALIVLPAGFAPCTGTPRRLSRFDRRSRCRGYRT